MTTRKEFVENILEKLQPLNVNEKPLFGEFGLYFKGKMFRLICDDTLFVKITEEGRGLAGRIAQVSPYPGAKLALKISSVKLNDREWITKLIEVTTAALPTPKNK